MSITLEQIDLLRERAKVSYQDAKDALEKCDNNIVEALVYLEREKKTKPRKEECTGRLWERLKELVKKGNETRFVVKRDSEENIINLSLNVMIIITIITTPIFVGIGLILAILTKHKIRIERPGNKDLKVNEIFDRVSDTVTSVKDDLTKKSEEN